MGQDYFSCGLLVDEEMAAFPTPLAPQASVTWCTAISPGHPTFSKALAKETDHALNSILRPGLSTPFANICCKKLRGKAGHLAAVGSCRGKNRTCFLNLT